MIRSIKVELNAAFPNMPLLPFHVFHGSAAAITVLNVPRRIVSLSVKVKNVSAVDQVFPAQRSGSAWVAVIPGSFFEQSGTSTRGVRIEGVDEAGNIYTLGAADLVVMLDNGTVSPVTPSVVDDTVTRDSPRPVKSSGIWSAIWGALTALPTEHTSLYDWCVAKLGEKRDKDDLKVYEKVPNAWTITGTWDDPNLDVKPYRVEPIDDVIWSLLNANGSILDQKPISSDGTRIEFFSNVTATRSFEFRPVSPSDFLAKVSQLPTAAEKDAWNGKQDKIAASGMLKGNGSGGVSAAEPGVDYLPAMNPEYSGVVPTVSSDGTLEPTTLFIVDILNLITHFNEKADKSDIIDPALAAAVGKIADAKLTRDFVNAMVSTNSAHYLTARAGTAGAYTYPPFASAAALRAAVAAHTEQTPQFFYAGEAFTPTKNDWVIVSEDEDHPIGTIIPASRYGFVGTFGSGGSFQYQVSYKLPLTTAQIAALDSNITAALVAWLSTFKGTDTATTLASIIAKLANLESDGFATDTFATDLLGKPVANAKVRYKLSTVSSTTMSDRTTNFLQMNGNATLTFPEAIVIDGEKYSRDFLLRVKVTTAGSLTLPADIALAPYSDDFDFTKANDWLLAFTEEGVGANGKAEFYIRAIG